MNGCGGQLGVLRGGTGGNGLPKVGQAGALPGHSTVAA